MINLKIQREQQSHTNSDSFFEVSLNLKDVQHSLNFMVVCTMFSYIEWMLAN